MTTPDFSLWKINPETMAIQDTLSFTNTGIDLMGARIYGHYQSYLFISTLKSQLLLNTTNNMIIYLNRQNGLILNQGSKELLSNGRVFFTYSGAGITQYAVIENLISSVKNIIPQINLLLVNNKPIQTDTLIQYKKTLSLHHTQNTITINFSALDQEFPERLEYAYMLVNTDKEWTFTNGMNSRVSYANLAPGKYLFKVKAREWGQPWSPETTLQIIISPPFWQTWWFILISLLLFAGSAYLFFQWRINSIRKQEQLKNKFEKELLELEAKSLRAQMNPHFIFNCMNSIKALIQKNEQEKAITYLTTFSKLIRIIFEHSDKREVSLYEEIETCKLYTELEMMRFQHKFSYQLEIDPSIDMKSIMIPALIIQPFIENAIWHGLMPKEGTGFLQIRVTRQGDHIECIIDDDGIGRKTSEQNKSSAFYSGHQSRGVHLTHARLDLDNQLNEKNASIKIIDKTDSKGRPLGTTVVLCFEYLNS